MRRFSQIHFNETTFFGWIKSINKLKNKTFVKVQDGSSSDTIQIVFNNNTVSDNLKRGNCIKVSGNLVESMGKGQKTEVRGMSYDILSNYIGKVNESDDKIHANDRLFGVYNTALSPDLARNELLHLRHRLDYFAAMCRIRAGIKNIIRSLMYQKQYLEVDPPHLTNIDCEGAGETFHAMISNAKIKTVSPKLSVSGQLHLEALVLGLSHVYSFGPVFRANMSGTRHHLSEFVMLEMESVRLTDVDCLCTEIESVVRHVIESVINTQSSEMAVVGKSNIVSSNDDRLDYLGRILENGFSRITHKEAMAALQQEGIIDVGCEKDMRKVEEQRLIEIMGGHPIFVTEFPARLKPFYCKSGGDRSLSVDLLLPDVGEVAGGTVREDDLEILRAKMRLAGVNETEMDWYLDLRRDGGCPHGGFGLGLDRLIQFVTGVKHIQDVVTFPRTFNDCLL